MENWKVEDKERIEVLLLTNNGNIEDNDLPVNVKNILIGQYQDVLENALPVQLIKSCSHNNLQEIVNHNILEQTQMCNDWLCVGIASLLYFVQYNWTGPLTEQPINWLSNKKGEALQYLSLHDECNENVKKIELLYFSKIIFANKCIQEVYKSSLWWLFRTNFLHQSILEEASGIIFEETQNLISTVNTIDIFKNPLCEALFNVEATQFYLYYKRVQESEKCLEHAQSVAQLTMNLEGAMGKRTKYQHEDKAQLVLKINVEKDVFPSRCCENVPKSVDLNDDLRLEHIQFTENQDVNHVKLGAVEEAIILAKHTQLQLSQPKDKLTDEETIPYITRVIDSTQNWSLKMTSLSYRCTYESVDKRTIERSVLQAENLLKEINDSKVSVSERIDMFFASGMKPVWILEKNWAHLMMNLGLVKGALDIFLKLKLWEEVIVCYNILELRHMAAEIIRQEIAKKPTVKLWCLLGDATSDVSHYETAWKLSEGKSSRVQRHWGFFYFARKNYAKAIPHLKLSVELNNIQEKVWLRLGFAALQTENWELAATAYRRYCALEQTTFEAWNNLAKAYIKLGDKYRAWKALQDAVKCNYDRWEVWDNLMVVSVDLGLFSEVIRCYHRILDLKNEHTDIQVLYIVVKAIVNDINDADENSSRKLLQKMLELFGRITSRISNNPDIWKLYAELTMLKQTDADEQKAAQYLLQAYRAAVSDSMWYQKQETVTSVLELCRSLSKTHLHCATKCSNARKRALLGSAKLALQAVITKVKDVYEDDKTVSESLQNIEEYLKIISNELQNLKLDV